MRLYFRKGETRITELIECKSTGDGERRVVVLLFVNEDSFRAFIEINFVEFIFTLSLDDICLDTITIIH